MDDILLLMESNSLIRLKAWV